MRSTALTAVLAIGLVAMTGSALAQTSVTPTLPANTDYREYNPTNPPSAPNGDNTIVCNYQRETGSLLITRVCRTLRAWKLMQADAKEFMGFGFRGSHQVDENASSGGS
ncbi:MAG TPA: hypothetical protein VNU97_19490 [Rhizomicrobium sp.]|jgi:hypothetical protein|nr:hypothetical protein [Rhizomicrobium sp.]